MENKGKLKTRPQSPNARQTKRFERKCFYYDKLGQRQAERRQKVRDTANRMLHNRDRQQNTDDRPQYNRKLVCHICGYTGHSPKYCNQRWRNASPHRQVQYEGQTPDEIRNQRRQIKMIMKQSPKKSTNLRKTVGLMANPNTSTNLKTMNLKLNQPHVPLTTQQVSDDSFNKRAKLKTTNNGETTINGEGRLNDSEQTSDEWLTLRL